MSAGLFEGYLDLVTADQARPRSSSGIGPSGLLDCSRRAVHTMLGSPACNTEDKWAAIRGTAVHAAYTEARAAANPDAQVEVELQRDGLRGNADVLFPDLVEDLKTATIRKVQNIKAEGPSRQHLAQINWYAWAAGVPRWRLVYAPLDGRARDWHVVEGEVDESLVYDALAWLYNVRAHAARGEFPPPEKPAASFCRSFCRFYDAASDAVTGPGCPGLLPAKPAPGADPFSAPDPVR